jgi:hypothetical protein
LHYYYFSCLVYMDPFDEGFFDSLVFFSAHTGMRVVLFTLIRWEGIVAC